MTTAPSFNRRRGERQLIVLLAALVLAAATAQAPLGAPELRLVAARITPDQGFPEHGAGVYTNYLRDRVAGGRLLLIVANDGSTPLTIDGLELNGTPFEQLTDRELFNGAIAGLNWWQAAPQTVPPGGLTSVRMRLLELADLGPEPISFTLRTDAGPVSFEATPSQPSLWLPFVGFLPDEDGRLTRAVIYLGNDGSAGTRVWEEGSVRIDDRPVDARLVENQLAPGAVVPLEVALDPPVAPGAWVVIEVRDAFGASTFGSLRAFPASFSSSFWDLGYAPDLDDPSLDLYGIDRNLPAADDFVDEPFRVRLSPTELAARIGVAWQANPERPIMIQFTGYEETLVYSDISDIAMTHHRDTEQELSHYLSWPKPIWYLSQNAWGRNSRPGGEESWYPLEDLRQQSFSGIARGAKHLQWFTYWNLWQQGNGRGGSFDSNRTSPDLAMSGAVANPRLLDHIGRITKLLRMLEPYLAVSAPAARTVTPAGIEATTLLSGTDRAVVVLIDKFTPEDVYERSRPGPTPAILTDQHIELQVPPFVTTEAAFLVDPLEGVRPLPLERGDGDRVRLTLTRFQAAALVVLGTEDDGRRLAAAWRELVFPDPQGTLKLVRESARPLPAEWLLPNRSWRLPVTVDNPTEGRRQIFDMLVSWPPGIEPEMGSLVLVEAGPEGPQSIPVLATGPSTFIDFELPSRDLLATEVEAAFEELIAVEQGPEGVTNRYRSHPGERYGFVLIPQPEGTVQHQEEAWISTDFRRLEVEARGIEAAHEARNHQLLIDFDVDGDGNRDGGVRLVITDLLSEPLAAGWRRYRVDIGTAFRARFPELEVIQGQWRPRFQVDVFPSERPSESRWQLRRLLVGDNGRLTVIHPEGLEAAARRSFELYFNERGTSLNPDLPERRNRPDLLPAVSGPAEPAGVAAELDGATLTVRPQADTVGVLVRHWGREGELLQSVRLGGQVGYRAILEPPPGAGDLLSLTTLLPNGSGYDFFLETAPPLPRGDEREAVWTLPLDEGVTIVDGDLSPDGRLAAVAERYRDGDLWFGRVRLLDAEGEGRWSWPPDGEMLGATFFARFAASGDRLYVAAQQVPIGGQSYDDVALLAFDLDASGEPRLRWRQQVASGLENAGRAIRQLVPMRDGGAVYGDWNGHIIRLDRDGDPIWQSGVSGYVRALSPTSDGGALALNFFGVHRIDPDGRATVIGRRADGTENQGLWATPEGDVIAFVDSRLRFLDSDARYRVGRHPRVVSGVRTSAGEVVVAVGASDGRVQLFDAQGRERWSREQRGSTVADIAVLADGTVAIAREVFRYDLEQLWRFRTEIEVVTLDGELQWHHAGPWHRQPVMGQLRSDRDGTALMVLGGELLRLALP